MFAGAIAGGFVYEAAIRTLTMEQKAILMDASARSRQTHLIVIAALGLLAMIHPRTAAVAVIVYFPVVCVVSQQRVRQFGFPAAYVQQQMIGGFLTCLGIVAAMVLWGWPWL
jgi:hypothetical protein